MKRLAAAASAALLTVTTAAAVSLPARASAKGMWWVPCHKRLLCTHVQVPLDYDDPHGVQISIALAKQPATDPTHRIGSLFINPGGPGESGIGFLADAGLRLFTPQVRARFDIIGFDPRGIDHSTQLQCFATVGAAGRAVPGFFYPDTAKRRATWLADDRKVESACARRGGAILDHMSTADVARDLDRLRAAVGDTALTYNGFSYGSFLGNVYANLFPDRVRAVVLDGVVNPVAWTTGSGDDTDQPFSTRMNSARGALTTLNEFFRLCDAGGSNCALAPHSRQKFFELYERLRAHPVHMGGGTVYDETFLVANTLSVMYESAAWDGFAEYLVYLRHRDLDTDRRRRTRAGAVAIRPLRQHRRGLSRSRVLRLGQPAITERVDGRGRRGRLVRPALDVGLQRLRPLAGPGRRPLPRPVHEQDGEPGAGRRQLLRPGDAVSQRAGRSTAAAQLTAAHSARLGAHLAVPVALRGRRTSRGTC